MLELSKDDNEETSEHGNNESLSLKDHCDIEFEDIHLTLHRKTSDKVLLDGSMKGKISSGRMLAIMGPSGELRQEYLCHSTDMILIS